jgi:hypothetical protein
MEFKGTKGKWVQNGENGVHTWEGRCIALTYNEKCKANALLISKAPEMLEMLERIASFDTSNWGNSISLWPQDVEKLKDIISKSKQLIKSATEI